jgi:predicted RND superfamily exporter protein
MVPGIIKLKTDIYSLSALPVNNKAVKDHFFIEENIGNYFPIEYVINMDKADLVNVDDWIYSVYNLEKIDGDISYLSFPQYIDAQQYGYKEKGGNLGRITFLAPLLSTSQGRALVDKIDSIGNNYFINNRPKITGFVTLYGILAEKLGESFLYSLFLAFLSVFTIIFLYLKNTKLFIASIFPNIFPIVTILGLMGWLNIPLDMVTVPIGCLLLSIIVDDTIHFIFWYKKTADIRETYKEAGPGIIYTSIVLVTGFSVFLISSSPPIRNFGILSITAMLSALCGDLILLPVILKLLKNDNSKQVKEDMK